MLDRSSPVQKSQKEMARMLAKDSTSHDQSSHSSSMDQKESMLIQQASMMSESLHNDEEDTCDINQGPDISSLLMSQQEMATMPTEKSIFYDDSSYSTTIVQTESISTEQASTMSLYNDDSEKDTFDIAKFIDELDEEMDDLDEEMDDLDEDMDDLDKDLFY